jgi:hypothetical protein
MSDIFHNLALRAGGGESAVRPRLAGRFEQSEQTGQLVEVNEEIESAHEETSSAAAQFITDSENRYDPRVQEDAPQKAGAIETKPAVTESRLADQPGSTPLRPSVREEPVTDGRTPATAFAPFKNPRLIADQAPPPRDESSLPKEPPVPDQASSATASKTTQDRLARPPVVATPVQAAPHAWERAAVTRAMPIVREVLTPGETVVHVSIGRIELRAPPAAPPRKREETVSPVTPLAEYLRQHALRSRS